tara:strand:- start:75 stop:293 length:219 start_codon:yes stop_codon:yes gene_type:complete
MTHGFSMGDLVWASKSQPKMGVVVGFDTTSLGQLQAILVVWLFQYGNTYRFLADDCEIVDPDIKSPGSLRST